MRNYLIVTAFTVCMIASSATSQVIADTDPDAILQLENSDDNGITDVETSFSIQRGDSPAALNLLNRQAVMNSSQDPNADSLYIMFSAVRGCVLANVPHYKIASALSEFCCFFQAMLPNINDIHDADVAGTQFLFFVFSDLEHPVLSEATLHNDRITLEEDVNS